MKTQCVIDPVDTLFFRDARPFSDMDNSVGQISLFPPAPHTMVGAIRAQWAAQQGWSGRGRWKRELLEKLGGDEHQLHGVAFSGPELAAKSEQGYQALYPAPAALIGRQSDDTGKPLHGEPKHLVRLIPADKAMQTDMGKVRLPVVDAPKGDVVAGRKHINDAYLNAAGLNTFLAGKVPCKAEHWYAGAKQSALKSTEARVCNQVDKQTGRVVDGMLYSTNHIRLNPDIRLLMQIESESEALGTPSHIALGGEGRAATIEAVDEHLHSAEALADFDDTRYLIYLRTPLLLGEQAKEGTPLPRAGTPFLELPGKVVSACLYPVLRYGEWLQENGRRESTTRSVVPAGSVIFMQAESTQQLANLAGCEQLGERTSWGYGRMALGRW